MRLQVPAAATAGDKQDPAGTQGDAAAAAEQKKLSEQAAIFARFADATKQMAKAAADAAVDFSTVNGKANLFFSAASTVLPFVGACL